MRHLCSWNAQVKGELVAQGAVKLARRLWHSHSSSTSASIFNKVTTTGNDAPLKIKRECALALCNLATGKVNTAAVRSCCCVTAVSSSMWLIVVVIIEHVFEHMCSTAACTVCMHAVCSGETLMSLLLSQSPSYCDCNSQRLQLQHISAAVTAHLTVLVLPLLNSCGTTTAVFVSHRWCNTVQESCLSI
jgi:hypothetical protein